MLFSVCYWTVIQMHHRLMHRLLVKKNGELFCIWYRRFKKIKMHLLQQYILTWRCSVNAYWHRQALGHVEKTAFSVDTFLST